MEVRRAGFNFKAESLGNFEPLKFQKYSVTKFSVKADLFLLSFKKGQKLFWRQGKPVHIKAGEVIISNSQLEAGEYESTALDIFKIPAKKLACYINENLLLCSKSNLPLNIEEWPEILLKSCSPLAKTLSDLSPNLLIAPDHSTQQTHIYQVLNGFFQSLDLDLFVVIERLKDLKANSRKELLQKVATVNEYMQLNLEEDLSLELLSELVGYSHFHFQRQYKLAMGISPTKKLSILRLKKAQELMRTTDYRLKEIAGLVGYNDLPTFSKAYKRQYGKSPNYFR